MRKFAAGRVLKVLAMVLAGITLFALIVERLWNWLVPSVFGGKSITFVQALGLLVLSKILFGGFHRGGGGRPGWRREMGRRWAAMTPEERERFRAGLRGRHGCNWEPAHDPAPEQGASIASTAAGA